MLFRSEKREPVSRAEDGSDQILVLGNGTLEGNGTHDELMKTCEVYREIYFSQFPEERAAYNNESGVIA